MRRRRLPLLYSYSMSATYTDRNEIGQSHKVPQIVEVPMASNDLQNLQESRLVHRLGRVLQKTNNFIKISLILTGIFQKINLISLLCKHGSSYPTGKQDMETLDSGKKSVPVF